MNANTSGFTGLPDNPALLELKGRDQWVAWRYEDRDGPKPTKPPLSPRNGNYAKSSEPQTWGSYDEAAERARRDGLPGVGFMLAQNDNLTGYDFDDCLTRAKRPKKWVQELLEL